MLNVNVFLKILLRFKFNFKIFIIKVLYKKNHIVYNDGKIAFEKGVRGLCQENIIKK
jgi:hypothetical protein